MHRVNVTRRYWIGTRCGAVRRGGSRRPIARAHVRLINNQVICEATEARSGGGGGRDARGWVPALGGPVASEPRLCSLLEACRELCNVSSACVLVFTSSGARHG
ncbi:hypothetical protein ACJJTC_005999 [Scirpophaga incertulas]